jgi:V/A-type H+-transporting ATPase subunit I
MIIPMKKVSLVVMEAARETSLEKLREIGVVHLEKKSVSSDALGNLLEKRARIGKTIGILRRYPIKKGAPQSNGGDDLVSNILN